MKTNTLNLILAAVGFTGIALISTTKLLAHFDVVAMVISYTAVGLLAAMALYDNRSNVRRYSRR
ncbi:MAG: hypothetical protein JWQ62_240 [Lacunisphaera sp.]|nr:hypothetical protein [Lacunisphaera sp.]